MDAYESTLDTIRLDHDEGAFGVLAVTGHFRNAKLGKGFVHMKTLTRVKFLSIMKSGPIRKSRTIRIIDSNFSILSFDP